VGAVALRQGAGCGVSLRLEQRWCIPDRVVELQDSAGTRRPDSGLSRPAAAAAASDSRQAELAYSRIVRDWRGGGADKGGRDGEISARISWRV
jgi:hypothetical protein